jgi:hypothetical protein
MMMPDTKIAIDQAQKDFDKKYFYNGKYDRRLFLAGFLREFCMNRNCNSDSNVSMCKLLGFIELDSSVTDVRWVAYMLATALIETGPKMEPVDEFKAGRNKRYGSPVKVFQLSDGRVRITEQDGDQVTMNQDGKFINAPNSPKAKFGSTYGANVDEVYEKDLGIPHIYYGRGYVQTTWWDGYAQAGVALGQGLKFLLHPEKINELEWAYKIMANRMVNGVDVKGKKTLATFINKTLCDYAGARALVNPGCHKFQEIAESATKFELILRESIVMS